MPDIFILLETHVQILKIHTVYRVIGLEYNMDCILVAGRSGGVLVFLERFYR